ncbi:hypothetical protein EOM60_03700 [Candidatus Saccharibacteria bacterium]|nr:hypothetical protein [Candidatus Saccharibacteria bacterium]
MSSFRFYKVKNKSRQFDAPAYYHVFNRGVAKQKIFVDTKDKHKFIELMERYLLNESEAVRGDGLSYTVHPVKVVAYCLMGNHFHLLLFQDKDPGDISRFMKELTTAYSMYFNLRHRRKGPVFEGMFQAVHVMGDSHFDHLTRYIHLNPRTYRTYRWSSLPEYLGRRSTSWVCKELAMDMTPSEYSQFMEGYTDRAEELKKIKSELDL